MIVSVGGFSKEISWAKITEMLATFAEVDADTLAL